MISLLCKKCGKHWYTANTRYEGNCESCGGELEEDTEEILAGNKEEKRCVKPVFKREENK